MSNLRRNFERFCLRHRNWGIPNLMLWVAAANMIVYMFTVIDPSNVIYSALVFDRQLILQGQLWRLLTYILIPDSTNLFFMVIFLFFYYSIGRILESHWGRFRFNLFYFSGVILTDIAAMLLGGQASTYYLDMSLILSYVTLYPEAQFLLFFIIPLKAKYLAWVYLGYTAVTVIIGAFPYNLYPILALMNYLLFFGSDVLNVFSIRRVARPRPAPRPHSTQSQSRNAAPNANWADHYRSSSGQKPYHHKCTICGRTDTDYPELEFRYCSRCQGYHCYCMDHINNHTHIQ